jgi:hypothetical protein
MTHHDEKKVSIAVVESGMQMAAVYAVSTYALFYDHQIKMYVCDEPPRR